MHMGRVVSYFLNITTCCVTENPFLLWNNHRVYCKTTVCSMKWRDSPRSVKDSAARGSATVPSKRAWMLVFKNADSMSSWRHEIHDFQTGNFLNLTAKGYAWILFTKYFFLIWNYDRTNVLLYRGEGKLVPRQRACESAREAATEFFENYLYRL